MSALLEVGFKASLVMDGIEEPARLSRVPACCEASFSLTVALHYQTRREREDTMPPLGAIQRERPL